EHAARLVDFLDGEIEAALVGLEERRLGFVAVELADLDGLLGGCGQRPHGCQCDESAERRADGHGFPPSGTVFDERPFGRAKGPCGAFACQDGRSRRRSISDFSWPPSTSIMVPLTMCMSGEASITTRFATSSTSAMRPSGIELGASLSASSYGSFM